MQSSVSDTQGIQGPHCCMMAKILEWSITQQMLAGWVNNQPLS